jgi:hypothetical protein
VKPRDRTVNAVGIEEELMASTEKSGEIELDFTDVEDRIPKGEYLMEVSSVEEDVSHSGNDMLIWKFKGLERQAEGKVFYFHTALTRTAIWKLRQTLAALGVPIPDEPFTLKLNDLIGRKCVGSVIDDTYFGQDSIRSKLNAVLPAEEESRSKEKIDQDDVEYMSESKLADLVDKYDLGVDLRAHKGLQRKAAAVIKALDAVGLLA